MARYIKKLPGEPRKKRLEPYPAKMCFNVSSDLPERLNLVAAHMKISPSNLIRFALENYVRFSEVTFNIGGQGAPFDCELERKAPSVDLPRPAVSILNHLPVGGLKARKVQGELFD